MTMTMRPVVKSNRLTDAQRYNLIKHLEQIGQDRIRGERWTLQKLADHAGQVLKVTVTTSNVENALAILGFRIGPAQSLRGVATITDLRDRLSAMEKRLTELEDSLTRPKSQPTEPDDLPAPRVPAGFFANGTTRG